MKIITILEEKDENCIPEKITGNSTFLAYKCEDGRYLILKNKHGKSMLLVSAALLKNMVREIIDE